MSPAKSDAGLEAVNLHDAEGATKSDSNGEEGGSQPISTITGQTTCSVCQSTFRRPEHLKRHFRSHTKEKPFECTQCGRHFSRTDTLHRHELSHHTLGSDGGKDRTHRITVKTFRACFKCAVARVRCSGGTPCTRCETRTLECQYPTERRSKAKTRREIPHNSLWSKNGAPHKQTPGHGPSSEAGDNLTQLGEQLSTPAPSYQIGQFRVQLPGINTSHSPSDASSDHNTHPNPSNPRVGQSSIQVKSESHGAPEIAKMPFQIYDGLNPQQPYPKIPTSDIRGTYTSGPVSEINPSIGTFHPELSTPNTTVHMTDRNDQRAQLALAQPFIDQSSLSTINWIPDDLMLDTSKDSPTVSGLQSQAYQTDAPVNALSRNALLPHVIDRALPDNVCQTSSGNTSLSADVDSPGLSVGNTELSLTSQPEASGIPKRAADSVNRADARPCKYARMQNSGPTSSADIVDALLRIFQEDMEPRFSFPSEERTQKALDSKVAVEFHIDRATYDKMYQAFHRLCCADNPFYQDFDSSNFPTAKDLSSFILLYFDYFQAVYPVLHRPTFDPNKCHWLLVLAVSAIGCQYARYEEDDYCAQAFHEFVRRTINIELEKYRLDRMPLWLLQAYTLNCIGMLHGKSERSGASALNSFSELANLVTRERLLEFSTHPAVLSSVPSQEHHWLIWVEDEIRRRTAYLVWLVDCTLAYHFDSRPVLCLDDGQAPLPSHEDLWEANSAAAWKELLNKSPEKETPSLYDAILSMYIEKKLMPQIGEFSHTLLIHALYHRMWEVGDYFRRPLSFWNPTAKKQSRESAIPPGSVWLPGIPSYSKWRNSACDCLDILHWTANSVISKTAGFEHPTVLHLHQARIILLAPFREIRALATSLATEKFPWTERQQTIEWHYILRWIRHDQYKARLAIAHAGTTLWHVRQYSANTFHEAVAVFLATLTLWAYGLCHGQVFSDTRPRHRGPTECMSIHLDNPFNDELYQNFVREGESMKAVITGVGDICGSHGPARILQFGCELLHALSSWGISKRLAAVLTQLYEISSQR